MGTTFASKISLRYYIIWMNCQEKLIKASRGADTAKCSPLTFVVLHCPFSLTASCLLPNRINPVFQTFHQQTLTILSAIPTIQHSVLLPFFSGAYTLMRSCKLTPVRLTVIRYHKDKEETVLVGNYIKARKQHAISSLSYLYHEHQLDSCL